MARCIRVKDEMTAAWQSNATSEKQTSKMRSTTSVSQQDLQALINLGKRPGELVACLTSHNNPPSSKTSSQPLVCGLVNVYMFFSVIKRT